MFNKKDNIIELIHTIDNGLEIKMMSINVKLFLRY